MKSRSTMSAFGGKSGEDASMSANDPKTVIQIAPTDFRFGPINGSSLNRHFVRWYWMGTHQNAIRSIDATPVSSRLCRSDRVGTFSMHATDADAGGRIQGRHHA